jgi:hypothetical protein
LLDHLDPAPVIAYRLDAAGSRFSEEKFFYGEP